MELESYTEMRKRHDKELLDFTLAKQKALDESVKKKEAEKEGRGGELPIDSEKRYVAEIGKINKEYNQKYKALVSRHYQEASQNNERHSKDKKFKKALQETMAYDAELNRPTTETPEVESQTEKEKKKKSILDLFSKDRGKDKNSWER